jgi:uncharacterized SAM-binding protein YcdF (DUF218 family)
MASIKMAGKTRRLRRRQPDVAEPPYAFRSVVTVTIGFLFFIGILVLLSMSSHDSRNETIVFTNPQDIPRSVLKDLHSILVLGGGVPDSIDHPPVYVERRCDDAASVVQQHKGLSKSNRDSLPILCLSAGTSHLPQLLSADGLPIWESTACAAYLAKNHGLSQNVYVETTSYDTIGNAFYARTSHTDVNGWRNLLIVTNEFHMERTKAIFDWIFLQCDKDDTRTGRRPKNYKLYYLSSPNVGLSEQAVQARKEREAQSEQTVRETLAPRYKKLKDVWGFLNQHHSLYTASKLVDRARGNGNATASEMVKQSYGAGPNNRKE